MEKARPPPPGLHLPQKRKGFVRMAMQHGAALVPCFAFGQSRQYT